MDLQDLCETIKTAFHNKTALNIQGGGSKHFYGRDLSHLAAIETKALSGIIQYEPAELLIQVNAGTLLSDVLQTLDSENQTLGFEPPSFGCNATIGGMVACGISGSRRPYAGSVRDFVLGVDIINGKGERLSFGGQVMKNVAGYDVSRLQVAAMGCLGLITELSFKVLPKPEYETTRVISLNRSQAHQKMLALRHASFQVSATAHFSDKLYVRFSGSETSTRKSADKFSAEQADTLVWQNIDNLELFDDTLDLWRISTAPADLCFLDEAYLLDWSGGQRWLLNPGFDPRSVMAASNTSGHATLVRAGRVETQAPSERFQPLTGIVLEMHKGLKLQFDPASILNPQKMYTTY